MRAFPVFTCRAAGFSPRGLTETNPCPSFRIAVHNNGICPSPRRQPWVSNTPGSASPGRGDTLYRDSDVIAMTPSPGRLTFAGCMTASVPSRGNTRSFFAFMGFTSITSTWSMGCHPRGLWIQSPGCHAQGLPIYREGAGMLSIATAIPALTRLCRDSARPWGSRCN